MFLTNKVLGEITDFNSTEQKPYSTYIRSSRKWQNRFFDEPWNRVR